MDGAVLVVPFQMNSTVERSIPVFGALVLVLDSVDEVVCVLLARVLDSKIVDDEAEGDRARLVLPEARRVSAGGILVLCEVLFEFNPRYVSSLGKAYMPLRISTRTRPMWTRSCRL